MLNYWQERADRQLLLDALLGGANIKRSGVDISKDWIKKLRAEISKYDELIASLA
jgi:hypothetical protein